MLVEDQQPRLAAVDAAVAHLERARERFAGVELPHLHSFEALGSEPDLATLQLIASVVQEVAPRHVIEFGSSPVTELLGLLGFAQGRMAVTTVEHDPWAARELLAVANPFAVNYRWFAFRLCPLVARRCGGALAPVYDDGMTVSTVPFAADLVVIQGPPAALGGRAGTIYQALGYARAGTLILLLQVRPGEAAMVEVWTEKLAAHVQFVPPDLLDRHLAFVVCEPLVAPFTLESPHALELAATRLSGQRA